MRPVVKLLWPLACFMDFAIMRTGRTDGRMALAVFCYIAVAPICESNPRKSLKVICNGFSQNG